MTKEKLPTINIKGKEYVLVKDRILAFNELFPNGVIQTEIIFNNSEEITIKARVIPNIELPARYFTGYSSAPKMGNIPPLENAETSAVGRALAMMGIGVLESVASADEMLKVQNRQVSNAQTSNKDPKILKEAAKVWSKEQVEEILAEGGHKLATGKTKAGKVWFALDNKEGQRGWIKDITYKFIKDLESKQTIQDAQEVFNN